MGILSSLKSMWRSLSPENPSVPISSPAFWHDGHATTANAAGVRVDQESALEYSPFWRGVNLIARDIAKLPLIVYRREGEGKERDTRHPAFNLLRYKSSRYMTAYQFRVAMMLQVLLQGNGYARIRRESGRPVELQWLDARRMSVEMLSDGRLIYVNIRVDGSMEQIQPENILHIKGVGDGIVGMSVLMQARQSLGLSIAAQEYGGLFFRNNATPASVLTHPDRLSDTALKHIKEQWQANYGARWGGHKTAILEEGMQVATLSMSHDDAQFLETREHQIRDAANWLGVPAHKLGDTTRTSFSSLEEENNSYLTEGLDPHLVNWEQECRDKLLFDTQKERDTHVIEFIREALTRASLKDQAEAYATGLNWGYLNRDEVRAMINKNPIPDGEGEKFFMPLNMQIVGEEEEEPAPAVVNNPAVVADQEDEESEEEDTTQAASMDWGALEQVLRQALERMTKRLTRKAKARSKDHELFAKFIHEDERPHREAFRDALDPIATLVGGHLPSWESRFFRRIMDPLKKLRQCNGDLRFHVEHCVSMMEDHIPKSLAKQFLEELDD